MDLSKRYFDIDGNPRTIMEMVRLEPEWAAHRIQEGEKALAKLASQPSVQADAAPCDCQVEEAIEDGSNICVGCGGILRTA